MNNSWIKKRNEISTYYTSLISKYGSTPRACDYGRPESQLIKFRVLSQILDSTTSTLLDVGCGFADYGRFLSKHHPQIAYTGIDITSEFILKARQLSPLFDLHQLDILSESPPQHQYDVVTANGIFYPLGETAVPIMHQLVKRLFQLASKAVSFNSLSTWCPDPEPDEFYADPLDTLAFCRSITPWVSLQHNYHSRDFTIFMFKENPYESIH